MSREAFNYLVDNDTLSLRDIAVDLEAFARCALEAMDEPCRYDHHDYCQTHWLDAQPCPVEKVRAVLAHLDSIEGYE